MLADIISIDFVCSWYCDLSNDFIMLDILRSGSCRSCATTAVNESSSLFLFISCSSAFRLSVMSSIDDIKYGSGPLMSVALTATQIVFPVAVIYRFSVWKYFDEPLIIAAISFASSLMSSMWVISW